MHDTETTPTVQNDPLPVVTRCHKVEMDALSSDDVVVAYVSRQSYVFDISIISWSSSVMGTTGSGKSTVRGPGLFAGVCC